MNRPELTEYHSELAGIPKSAKEQVGLRNSPLIKPILPEVVWDIPNEERTEQLIDNIFVAMFGELTPQERTSIGWANQVQEEYDNLPKQTSRERRAVKKLIAQTAGELLKNPQDITIAQKTWRGNESSRDGARESEEPFSKLVKGECLVLIRDKWKGVGPEQLAQLVRIYATNDPSKDFAKALLYNYFGAEEAARKK